MKREVVEFETEIRNGVIEIPEQYKKELRDGYKIKISILANEQQKRSWSIMDELAQKPVSVKGLGKLTKDEMHNRRL